MAAQNARRHGLSLSVFADPAHSTEVETLARDIAGKAASSELIEAARRIAAVQIELVRVRQVRLELIAQNLKNPDYERRFRAAEQNQKVSRLIHVIKRLEKNERF